MKIDPERLSSLRKKTRLTRLELEKKSGINKRTIQRLESKSESQRSQNSQEHTVNSLAKALGVKAGVLTGELPLHESGKAPDSDSERVQIGAQVAPKVRLAYDLVKIRYGVSVTELINMAPLFFALLAEGSLAWRREKLKELKEGIDRLEQIDGFWHGKGLAFDVTLTPVPEAIKAEENSIDEADPDLFGEHLLDSLDYDDLDPSTDNPLASYLRRLISELDITGVVDVDSGDLRFGSPLKFPDYDICRDELDGIANGSASAKVTLETGHVRLSEIPEELMAEDAGEKRANWFGDRLPDPLKEQVKKIEALEKRMKALKKEIKEIDDRIKKIVKPEAYPEGVSEEESLKGIRELSELWQEEKKLREEMSHLEEKHREEQGRLKMLIIEEKDRSTSLSGNDPEGASKDIEEENSQEANSNTEKGGDDQ